MFSVNENKLDYSKQNNQASSNNGVTSPISQRNLLSKVNALSSKQVANPIINPQNIVFNADKGSTLNYKFVVDELVKLIQVDNIQDFDNHGFYHMQHCCLFCYNEN